MKEAAAAVLAEYALRAEEESKLGVGTDLPAYLEHRDSMLLAVGEDTGRLLNLLIRIQRPKTIVEVGTSYGYSTLWLAEAAQDVGATVTTCEISPEKHAYAAQMLHKAELSGCMNFVTGDAISVLTKLRGPIDFVLIDLWKELYIPVFDAIAGKLSRGAIVCADNMLFPEYQRADAQKYIAHVRARAGVQSTTLTIGSGVELSFFS